MTRSDTAESLTPLGWVAHLLGWLALFLSLALLSPGVTATANAETGHASEQAGPSCEAGPSADRMAANLEQMVEALQVEALAHAQAAIAEGDLDQPIVLNHTGYNYRNTPLPSGPAPVAR